MRQIAIEDNSDKICEGNSNYGYFLENPPILSFCKVYFEHLETFTGPKRKDSQMGSIFREDTFDPVSRLRRGRLYKAGGSNPQSWHIRGTARRFQANVYNERSIAHKIKEFPKGKAFIVFGDEYLSTVWKVINIEIISTGEELLTLKSLGTLGVLPELVEIENRDVKADIELAVQKVVDSAYRELPETVVDICRASATVIIGRYLEVLNQDLGKLIPKLETKNKEVAASAAKIINRFHSRGKPNEQKKHKTRSLREEDAELAVNCIGQLLLELDYAK